MDFHISDSEQSNSGVSSALALTQVPKYLRPILSEIALLSSIDWCCLSANDHEVIRDLNYILSSPSNEKCFMASADYNRSNSGAEVNRILLHSGLFDHISTIISKANNLLMTSNDEEQKQRAVLCLNEVTFLCLAIVNRSLSQQKSSNPSLLQSIFDENENIFSLSVQLLKIYNNENEKHTSQFGEEFLKAVQNAAFLLQVSGVSEKLLITGYLGRNLDVLLETACLAKDKEVRETILLLLKCFDQEILKANFSCFEYVRDKCCELLTENDTFANGVEKLNRIMATAKSLNFRKDHTHLLIKTNFLSKQCKPFYVNYVENEHHYELKAIQNFVELVWDGTNESVFTCEMLKAENVDIIDLHFMMLQKLCHTLSQDTHITRIIRIGLSIVINCHMDFEEETSAVIRHSCGISVLNNLLSNKLLHEEVHAAALDLIIKVSQPFEIERFRAPPTSIQFLMDHIEKCLEVNYPHECEAITPSGVRLPARNYFKTLNALCQCEENRGLIYTYGVLSLAQKMMRTPHNYDDVIYPLALIEQMIDYPEVAPRVESIVNNFEQSSFFKLYGKESLIIQERMNTIKRKASRVHLYGESSGSNNESDKDGKLRVMYIACGKITKSERIVVEYLKDTEGCSIQSFIDVNDKFSKIVLQKQLLSAQFDVLLVFLRKEMEKKNHDCVPIKTSDDVTQCYTHLLSYFSLTEQKSFLLVATEEDYKPRGWVSFIFETTPIFNTMQLDNFNSALSKEVDYIRKYEQSTCNVNEIHVPKTIPPWSKLAKTKHSHEQDGEMEDCYVDALNAPIDTWSSTTLKNWLSENGVTEVDKIDRLNGKQLMELAKLRQNSYELFWNEMRNYFELSLQDCLVLGNILNAQRFPLKK